jgi:hypothetical protein
VDAKDGKEEVAMVVVVVAARRTNFNCESAWCVPRLKRAAPAASCVVTRYPGKLCFFGSALGALVWLLPGLSTSLISSRTRLFVCSSRMGRGS